MIFRLIFDNPSIGRLTRLATICCAVWCLTLTPAVAQTDVSSLLSRADNLRLSDPDQAQQLLNSVEQDQLSAQQQLLFRYLTVYLSTFDGDIQATLEGYKRLLGEVPDSGLRIRVLTSMLGLASYTKNWRQSFELAGQLDDLLERIDAPSIQPDAYKGLLVFYSSVEQPDIALIYASQILQHAYASGDDRCFALSMQNEISLARGTVTEDAFYDALEVCKAAKQPYYIGFNIVHLFDFYMQQGELVKAQTVAEDAMRKINAVDYIFLKSGFLAALAELKVATGQPDEAIALAREVIKMDQEEQYPNPLISAYRLLASQLAEAGDYQQAYTHQTALTRLEASLHDQRVEKSLALQQARFDLKNKESQIELLDKRNQLLSTEARLVREQVQSMVMVLILALLAVVALLFWSYRTRKLQAQLKHLAAMDTLTGIYNRHFFTERAKQTLQQASEAGLPVALILFDLDHFKRINDSYGHQTGDWVLQQVIQTVREQCRAYKHELGRIGGEEFGILLKSCDSADAVDIAEACRKAIQHIDTLTSGQHFTITASFGVSDTLRVGFQLDNLFSAADLALFQSKKYGRNQVHTYESDTPP